MLKLLKNFSWYKAHHMISFHIYIYIYVLQLFQSVKHNKRQYILFLMQELSSGGIEGGHTLITDLWVVPVGLVKDLHDYFGLMHEAVISQLFPDPFEDFGKSPLTQAFVLKARPQSAFLNPKHSALHFYSWELFRKHLRIQDLLSWFCETPSDWCCVCWLMETEARRGPCCSCIQAGRTFLGRERNH